jgi:hypothetical protein
MQQTTVESSYTSLIVHGATAREHNHRWMMAGVKHGTHYHYEDSITDTFINACHQGPVGMIQLTVQPVGPSTV